jgi:hypothetical protein
VDIRFSEFASLPVFANLPSVREVAVQIDAHLSDLRAMLLLPLPEPSILKTGLNFPTTQVLLNLASGVSVCLMCANGESIKGVKINDRTKRLREFLKKYYPWRPVDLDRSQAVEMIVKQFRNPGVHSLGFLPRAGDFRILKYRRTEEEIVDLHESAFGLREPERIKDPTLGLVDSGTALRTHMLYWGIVYATRRLAGDAAQMRAAEKAIREAYAP